MLQQNQPAPALLSLALVSLAKDKPTLLVFFETDCPTCQLTLPYLNALKNEQIHVLGISQDDESSTRAFVQQLGIRYEVRLDEGLELSRAFDPQSVPTMFLLDKDHRIAHTLEGFDKAGLNQLAALLGHPPIAPEHDGAPAWKPGCGSRHLEPELSGGERAVGGPLLRRQAQAASRVTVADHQDPFEFCMEHFADPLPVIPPTEDRVQAMVAAAGTPAHEVIARIPPCYGEATTEKIAANAVMAGCKPEMMRVLLPLVRAVCDERFNIHGVQATTHFAAPLIMINGPVREQLGFWSRQNVYSNVARANSTLGRALQLILLNIGGGRPTGIDMSAQGNPGKFSYCIAENEEQNPWEPFHVSRGFKAG
jgi:peroxiredoxin